VERFESKPNNLQVLEAIVICVCHNYLVMSFLDLATPRSI